MSFLDRVKHYVPGVLRNMFVAPFYRRSNSLCPNCDYECEHTKHDIKDSISRYLFKCERCNLTFRYAYLGPNDDEVRILQVIAVCPECKENHAPQIFGPLETTNIPCEPCWLKTNKPFDPDETQLVLLPGTVAHSGETKEDENLEDTRKFCMADLEIAEPEQEENTSELWLPAVYRK